MHLLKNGYFKSMYAFIEEGIFQKRLYIQKLINLIVLN